MKKVNTIFTQTNLIIAKQSYESCITTLKLDTAAYNRLQEKYEDSKTTLDKARQDFEAEIQVKKSFLTNILGCGTFTVTNVFLNVDGRILCSFYPLLFTRM